MKVFFLLDFSLNLLFIYESKTLKQAYYVVFVVLKNTTRTLFLIKKKINTTRYNSFGHYFHIPRPIPRP